MKAKTKKNIAIFLPAAILCLNLVFFISPTGVSAELPNGSTCGTSADCDSAYCSPQGVCVDQPATPTGQTTSGPGASSPSGSTDCGSGFTSQNGLCMPSTPFDNNNAGSLTGSKTIGDLIANVIKIILDVIFAIAIVFLIIGGFWYITSAGNEEQAEKGRRTLINAIIGITLVILSYVIVTVVGDTLTKSSPTTSTTQN